MSSTLKVKMMLSLAEAGDLLSRLGQDLPEGLLHIGDTAMPLEGFKSIELSLKAEDSDLRCKLKVKYHAPVDTSLGAVPPPLDEDGDEVGLDGHALALDEEDDDLDEDESPPGYKKLKKRMKAQFKAMRELLERGQLPPSDLVTAFTENSDRMVTFPGKGDEYYQNHTECLGLLLQALADKDVEQAKLRAAELNDVKRACHDRYK